MCKEAVYSRTRRSFYAEHLRKIIRGESENRSLRGQATLLAVIIQPMAGTKGVTSSHVIIVIE